MLIAPKSEVFSSDSATTLTQISSFSAEETAGAVAKFYLRDTTVGGTIIVRCALAAGETVNMNYSSPIDLKNGKFFFDLVSGAVTITVHGR